MVWRTFILTWAVTTLAIADTVTLSNGTVLDGEVKRTDGSLSIKLADGSVRTLTLKEVKSISIGGGNRGDAGGNAALASLRRAVENLPDIDQIINRYQQYLSREGAGTPAAMAAEADLTMWRQRKTDGYVRHGGRWVRPDEVAAFVAKSGELTEDARDLIRANKIKEADQTLQNALALDPQNPSANYLHGVLAYRSEKLVEARKAFEAVNAAVPSHPPTLNNIAVILYRQNAVAPALNFYDQALQAAGVNKYILDNVAQTLGVLTDEQKKFPTAVKALRRFAELDSLLQQQLAQKGLYRWGGRWVTQKQLDELKADERDVRDQITKLQKQFDDAQARLGAIDTQIRVNQQQMADLQLRSSYTDSMGVPISLPLPQAYYELQAQNGALTGERTQLQQHVPEMQQQARELQARVPKPTFTGIQQVVGVEGMPEIVSTASASASTTQATSQPGESETTQPGATE